VSRRKSGRLWVVDLFASHVLGLSPTGRVEVILEVRGRPTGLGWDADERLLALTADGRIFRERHGQLVELPTRVDHGRAPCNELTVDPHGRVFIGIFGLQTGALASLDGGSQRTVATDLLLPNGLALTRDGQTLIVAESAGQRLTAFTITPDGEFTDRRVWACFGPPATALILTEVLGQVNVWPDGIALDPSGAIWVANPFGHEVTRVLEGGQVTHRVSTGQLSPFACALGGCDDSTLFICAAPPSLDETARRTHREACLLATRVTEKGLRHPAVSVRSRPSGHASWWPEDEPAGAVGADVGHLGAARGAERAFVAADHGHPVERERCTASFAGVPHVEHRAFSVPLAPAWRRRGTHFDTRSG
jgi:sugar lactone lactonase YvrE